MSAILNLLSPNKNRLMDEHAFLSGKVDDLIVRNQELVSRVKAVQQEHAETKKLFREVQNSSADKDVKITRLQTQINTPKKNAKIRALVVAAASLAIGLGSMGITSALTTDPEQSRSNLLAGAVGVVAAVVTNCFCQLYMHW